jgi:hypothetical protein
MARNIRATASALMAISALAAGWTTGASAADFTAGEYPAAVAQELLESQEHVFTINKVTVACQSHFDGVKTLSGPSSSIELTPTYTSCNGSGTTPATVTHNSCTFDFTDTGQAHLTCPEGSPGIQVYIYNNSTSHGKGEVRCGYAFKPQTIEGISYSNKSPTYGLATVASTVAATRFSGSEADCGPASQSAGYNGTILLEALHEGEMVGIGVEGEFAASKYSATITGGQQVKGPRHEFSAPNRVISCPAGLDARESLSESEESVDLGPTYGTCFAFASSIATVTSNECWFVLSITEGSGDSWAGAGQLKCPEGKAGLEIHVFASPAKHESFEPFCKYLIEPQEMKGVSYKNLTPTYLEVNFASSLSVKRTAGSVLLCGPAVQTFSYKGSSILEALNEAGAMTSVDIG